MEGGRAASGKPRKRVTFKLVSASSADPRVASNPWQRTLVLKNSSNAALKVRSAGAAANDVQKGDKTAIPKEFLSFINPADFGIHENLTGPQKDALIAEVYGSHEEYERIAAKFADAPAPAKPKAEDLDDDCYFPKDGYDYSQHLATINPQNFIPAPRVEAAASIVKAELNSSVDFPGLNDTAPETPDDPELAEVLKALDESGSEAEDMDDDFVAKAMDNEDPDTFIDENELLWGGYKPLRRVTFEDLGIPKGDSAPAPVFGDQPILSDEEFVISDEDDDEDSDFDAEYDPTESLAQSAQAQLDALRAANMRTSMLDMVNCGPWGARAEEKETMDAMDPDGALSERILQLVQQPDDSESGDTVEFELSSDESEQWDVETVLTKYTNATNHPQRILSSVVRRARTRERPEGAEEPSAKAVPDVEYIELPQVVTTRRRDETAEEKRARKAAVKQAKAMITRMKKENKEALKSAKKKAAEKSAVGSYDIVNGVKYLRLK
ncbi:Protein LTV1 homolog [Babesia bigemina]|uniref:Protein LTV1 homolog n=1 Tax=Babesia bigemina TaxID=5866 RepID=A0A061D4Z0_BABBI|nr:Protein LTV1 homolog [Babesia bigemina]CDR95756.1 Protein LTV1 homolog [Babesia bigemina]|eukprot:XP_012767942.1 Protein LTV1 homolog [Babesia bigemina]